MTTLPITSKPNWADKLAQFLRTRFVKKPFTREDNIKLLTNRIVDELLASKFQGQKLSSADLGQLANEIPAELKQRILQRAENLINERIVAINYYDYEIAEAKKAAESIKV